MMLSILMRASCAPCCLVDQKMFSCTPFTRQSESCPPVHPEDPDRGQSDHIGIPDIINGRNMHLLEGKSDSESSCQGGDSDNVFFIKIHWVKLGRVARFTVIYASMTSKVINISRTVLKEHDRSLNNV